MKKYILNVFVLVSAFLNFANAQNANWTAVLPAAFPTNASGQINGISRVSQMKFHPTDSNKMYAVSARGGLFITADGGNNWTVAPGTDFAGYSRYASVCVDWAVDSIIYLGAGDHDYYYNGSGIWKSTNGGRTFSQTTFTSGLVVDMIMDPLDHNTIVAITNTGIYKTTNAGGLWVQKTVTASMDDIKQKSPTSRVLYASSNDTAFYRSTDFGDTWTQIVTGITLPAGVTHGNGCRIAVTPADTNVVYLAMVANAGIIYRSRNGGTSFTAKKTTISPYITYYDNLSTSSSQGDYNFNIGTDRTNPAILYLVAHCVWKSTDSGATWTQLTNWYAKCHTDMHQITTGPFNNNKVYNMNDGGVWLSTDGGNNWTPKSDGLAGYEIYHGNCSPTLRTMISIGTQDNGELYSSSTAWLTNRGGDWSSQCAFDYRANSSMVYYYQNNKRRLVNGSDGTYGLPAQVKLLHDIAFHRSNPNLAFVADSFIYRTTTLTNATPAWTQIANTGKKIMAMHSSFATPNYLFVITDDGVIRVSKNAQAATPVFTNYNLPTGSNNAASITTIKSKPNVIYITTNTQVYRSADTGATWTNITYNLPSVNHVRILADEYYSANELVFVASGSTVYYKIASANTWTIYNTNLPSRPTVVDLSIYNDSTANTILRYTSYGRGMWETPISNLRTLTANLSADNLNPCPGDSVHFTDISIGGVTTRTWTFTGGTPNTSTAANPVVVYNGSGSFNVSLTVSDGTNNASITKTNYIVTTAGTIPLVEGFEGIVDPPTGWRNIDNGTQGDLWAKTSAAGGYGTSTNSMFFDNYDWNIHGERDDLLVKRVSFTGLSSAKLTFDVAYQYISGYNDSLAVLVSTDCGRTFSRVYIRGGNDLSTAGTSNSYFTPTSAQWRTDTVNLTAYVGQSSVIIEFENIAGYGNNIYVDNININGSAAIVCPTPVLSGVGAPGSTILKVSTTGIAQIQWYNNGNLVSTTYSTPDTGGTTVAGGNGQGSNANQLNTPYGVSVDRNGNLYVCDQLNSRIQKWLPGATSGITVAGGNGQGTNANQLNTPTDLYVDSNGNIYIADAHNNRIQKWTPGALTGITVAGQANGVSGSAANQFNIANGVFVDAGGNVFVADYGNSRVQKWAPGATTGVTVAGGNSSGNAANQLSLPYGIFVDGSSNIYVADQNNHRIQKWGLGAISGTTVAGGNGGGTAANQLQFPTGVFVDNANNIYVADANNARIQKWMQGATTGVTIAGGNGQGSGSNQFSNGAARVYVSSNGAIYIADAYNHRVQRWLQNNPTYTPTTTGTYTALVTYFNSCVVTSNAVTITVGCQPATNTVTTSICQGNSYLVGTNSHSTQGQFIDTLRGAAANGCDSIVTLNLTVNQSTSSITNVTTCSLPYSWNGLNITSAGNDTVHLQNAANCDSMAVLHLTVSTISAGIISGDTTVCMPGTIQFTSSGTAGGVWSSSNISAVGTINQSGLFTTGTRAGTTQIMYIVSIANANGCSDTARQWITIFNRPLSGTISGDTTVCMPGTIQFTSSGTTGGVWSSSNISAVGTINQSGLFTTGTNAGTTQIRYIVTNANGCSDTARQWITIFNRPSAGTISGDTTVCMPGTIQFTSSGTTGGVWSSSNISAVGTINQSGLFTTGTRAGTTQIRYIVTNANGCSDTARQWITIFNRPLSGTISGDTTVCMPGTIQFTSSGTTGGVWSSSNISAVGTINQSGLFTTGINAGTTQIRYIVTNANGCSDTARQWITIFNRPSAGTISGDTTVCMPGTIQFTSSGTTGGVWSSSNISAVGTINQSGLFTTGTRAGTTQIMYVVTNVNGCSDTARQWISINQSATNVITTSICAGKSYTVGTQSFNANGQYFVTFPHGASTGCDSTVILNLTVNPNPTVTISGVTSICSGGSGTIDAGAGYSSYAWSTSASSQTISVSLANTYTVTVSNSNGCTATASKSITVTTTVAPSVTIAQNIGGTLCPGTTVTFTATPYNGGTSPSYQWKKNNTNVGINSATYSDNGLANGDIISVVMTSNYSCASPTTATSNSLTQSVNHPVLSNTGGGCVNDNLNLSNVSGATNIVWQKNGVNITTTNPNLNSTIFAGNNGAGAGLNQLNAEYGIFRTNVGDVYVADRSNHRVIKFAAGSTQASNGVVVAGSNGAGTAANQLNYPTSVVVDGSGNLYVCDQFNRRVQKFPAGSTSATNGVTVAGVTGQSGTTPTKLNVPNAICLDASGNLYVSDYGNGVSRVQKFPYGNLNGTTVAGANITGNTATLLNNPTGVAVDGSGNLYVADANNNRVQKFAAGSLNGTTVAGGNGAGTAANQLNMPQGLFLDASNNLYVADWNNYRVQLFQNGSTSATSGITVAGNGTSGAALTQMRRPQGVALDGSGNIYVADQDNNRISVWGAATVTTTYRPGAIGVYTATVTYPGGCVVTSNMDTIKATVIPYISILPSSSKIACGISVTFTSSTTNAGTAPTFQWYINSSPVAGATNPSYTSTTFHNNDTVTCQMVSNAPCVNTTLAKSGKVIMTVTGNCPSIQGGSYKVEEKATAAFNIYPNPATAILNCEITSEGDLKIVNEIGQAVVEQHLTNQQTQINIQHLAAGVYFYTFQSEGQVFRGKVVKD